MFAKTNNNNNPLKISVSNSVRVFFVKYCYYVVFSVYAHCILMIWSSILSSMCWIILESCVKKQSHLVLLFLQNLIFEKIYSHLKN